MKQLAVGDSVKIKQGVMKPYFGKLDLSGWQGRILKIFYEDLTDSGHEKKYLTIEYDSITLKQMTEEYILGMTGEGFPFAETEISYKDINVVSPRDSEEETTSVRMELNKKYNWDI
ncbi:MAG: hypothetical protein WCQ95_00865 [Bacteroidota bacterium]